jgi:hypothetical protein
MSSDDSKAVLRAYEEARRNILGDRRGLALIAAYKDRDLDRKLRKEYARILAREVASGGIGRQKPGP